LRLNYYTKEGLPWTSSEQRLITKCWVPGFHLQLEKISWSKKADTSSIHSAHNGMHTEQIHCQYCSCRFHMPSSRVVAFAIALLAFVAVFFSASTEATALTYNVAAHEKACFYTWADVPGKKVAFYFAVSFI
jgi:hypothetical protein